MKNSDSNNFLIPLLAAFAIYVPFSGASSSPDQRLSENPQSPALIQMGSLATPTPTPAPGRISGEAARLLCDFFGFKPEPDPQDRNKDRSQYQPDEPRNFDPKNLKGDYCGVKTIRDLNRIEHLVASDFKVEHLIATIPDPKDSRLDHLFDRNLDALQRAIGAAGYTFDRHSLPWDKSRPAAPFILLADQKTTQSLPRQLSEPGVILFRGSNKLLLLFLVGETPTGGIHKVAFQNALWQLEQIADWKRSKTDAGLGDGTEEANPKTLRIVGPTFSGSGDSLATLLRPWLRGFEWPPKVRIVSGSATSIDKEDFLEKIGSEGVNFHTTIVALKQASDRFYEYLENLDSGIERVGDGRPARARIALLSEAGTGYGQKVRKVMGSLRRNEDQGAVAAAPMPPILSLIFPLHISQLRVEAAKQSPLRKGAANAPAPSDPNLSLPMSEAGSPGSKDIVPLFSPVETVTMELALKETLSAIHRERIRYVGVSATDVQDRIFLVREIRKHCPNAMIYFILSNDLLYLHSESNHDFQGALIISPYPLFGLNQLWTYPFAGVRSRAQFSAQSSQGLYNATLALLDRDDLMLEYGFPFDKYEVGETRYPALWLGVVGRNGIWPVKTFRLDIPREDTSYTWPARLSPSGAGASIAGEKAASRLGLSGNYWSPAGLGVLSLIGIICLILPLIFLEQSNLIGRWAGRSLPRLFTQIAPAQWIRRGWPARVFGDEEFYCYGPDRRINLISCCVCLLTAALFISSVALTPAWITWEMMERDAVRSWWNQHLLLGAVAGAMLVLTLVALFWLATRIIEWMIGERGYLRGHIGVLLVLGVGAAMVVFVVLGLIKVFRADLQERVFFFLRASDLTNGVSILLPGLLIAMAAFLSFFTAVRRLNLAERMPCLRGPRQEPGDAPQFLRFDHDGARSFKGLNPLEDRVKEMIVCPIHKIPGAWLIAIVIFIVYLYLFLAHFIPSVEGWEFDWFFKLGFYIVPLMLFWALLRFYWLWRTLEKLLRRLSWHPLISRFAAGHSEKGRFASLPPVDLMTLTPTSAALSASARQARSFYDSFKLPPEQAETGERIKSLVEEADDKLSLALQSDAEGDWRKALVNRRDSQAALAELSEPVTGLLEDSWGTDGEGTDAAWRNEGKFFLIAHIVSFLQHIFAHLQNLVALVTIGLLLMLITANSYPFQPREPLRLFSWVGILTSVAVTIFVFVKISRDKTLSLLAGTTPGKLNVTRDFVSRVMIHGALPLIALLGAQFPEAVRQIFSWLSVFEGKGN